MAAADIIAVTLGGKTFRTCRFCAAHIEWTIERLAVDHPGATFRIIQPSWNDGVSASSGTHDKCACFDVEVIGLGMWVANRWLRRHGWWGWVRTTAQGFPWHIHTISAGCPAPKGRFVDGAGGTVSSQLDDYKRHALGLAGQHESGSDPECAADRQHGFSQFDYSRWLEDRWFEMATKEDLAAVVDNRIGAKLDTLLERTAKAAERQRKILAELDALDVLVADDATAADLAAVKQQVRKLRADVAAWATEEAPA